MSSPHPFNDPSDPAYRPPLDPSAAFPPAGEVDHPHLKELLYTHLGPERLVVDVGCGPGPFEYDRYACRFLAFDMFEPETREGMKEVGDEFRLGKLERFPLGDESCDAVVMGFILEHVPDPLAFLREADRVLRPGGWCYVAIPNGSSLEDRLFRLATRVGGSRRGPHIQRFSFDGFRNLAEESTSLRLAAWHFLDASYLWMVPRLGALRPPWIATLRLLGKFGVDGFRAANYQLLFRKPGQD